MDLLAAIKREERKLETELGKLQGKLSGVRAAAKALGDTTVREITQVKKRVLSTAAKAKISKATKARWAKFRAAKNKKVLGSSTIREVAQVKKRVLSAAARAKISKATKLRWAKFRAEKTKRRRLHNGIQAKPSHISWIERILKRSVVSNSARRDNPSRSFAEHLQLPSILQV